MSWISCAADAGAATSIEGGWEVYQSISVVYGGRASSMAQHNSSLATLLPLEDCIFFVLSAKPYHA